MAELTLLTVLRAEVGALDRLRQKLEPAASFEAAQTHTPARAL